MSTFSLCCYRKRMTMRCFRIQMVFSGRRRRCWHRQRHFPPSIFFVLVDILPQHFNKCFSTTLFEQLILMAFNFILSCEDVACGALSLFSIILAPPLNPLKISSLSAIIISFPHYFDSLSAFFLIMIVIWELDLLWRINISTHPAHLLNQFAT